MKKLIMFVLLLFVASNVTAQNNNPFYVDVIIYKDKKISIEGEQVEFNEISNEVQKRVLKNSLDTTKKVTYRVFADRELSLGYISDVESKMFDGYHKARRERYLLNIGNLSIDNSFFKLKG